MNHREQGREALAEQLRQLRGKHPELSLRVIGQRAQVSHTTVARALSTEDKLPSWSSIAAITQVLGGANSDIQPFWLWASTGAPPAPPEQPAAAARPAGPPPGLPTWFTPVGFVLTCGLIILAVVHGAMDPQSAPDRWIGDVTQTVFATAAAIAFGVRAVRDGGTERRWLSLACAATLCWTAAMVYWIVRHDLAPQATHGPTVAEIGFMGFSLLMIAALWLRLRDMHQGRSQENPVQTTALIAVAALSAPALIWVLIGLLDTRAAAPHTALVRLTYLHPIADFAMIAMAGIASVRGEWVTQSRLLFMAFGARALAGIMATAFVSADAPTGLVDSSEFGFTTFAVLLAFAAITPDDSRIRPAQHRRRLTRAVQLVGLTAVAIYTVTLATGNLPPAITPYATATVTLLLVIALAASPHHIEPAPARQFE